MKRNIPNSIPQVAPRLSRHLQLRKSRGFTMIEMVMVISIISILFAIAIPLYSRSILAARERALRDNLALLRGDIFKYTLDKQRAPQSLDDLVTAGYLRQLPVDPMTHETNWEVDQEEVLLVIDQQEPGITDVHSASNATAGDGTAYSTW